jgi:uncharacterized membrane protein YuzA (DUF378 family)
MMRDMEPLALLQMTPGVFQVVGTINSLVFGVFVASVVAAVFLFSVNRKLKRICQLIEKNSTPTLD